MVLIVFVAVYIELFMVNKSLFGTSRGTVVVVVVYFVAVAVVVDVVDIVVDVALLAVTNHIMLSCGQ